ncbi:MAG TPA: hypothetical protein VKB49_30050 [Candidatus Sulfotelmatobacter sp.]|nr:hypothetical protein [Candidatus Sulfotelmatobacter sp.]
MKWPGHTTQYAAEEILADCIDRVIGGTVPRAGFAATQDDRFAL